MLRSASPNTNHDGSDGLADEHDRTGDRVEHGGHELRIAGQAAQRVRRRDGGVPGLLKPADHTAPTCRLGECAVKKNDRRIRHDDSSSQEDQSPQRIDAAPRTSSVN